MAARQAGRVPTATQLPVRSVAPLRPKWRRPGTKRLRRVRSAPHHGPSRAAPSPHVRPRRDPHGSPTVPLPSHGAATRPVARNGPDGKTIRAAVPRQIPAPATAGLETPTRRMPRPRGPRRRAVRAPDRRRPRPARRPGRRVSAAALRPARLPPRPTLLQRSGAPRRPRPRRRRWRLHRQHPERHSRRPAPRRCGRSRPLQERHRPHPRQARLLRPAATQEPRPRPASVTAEAVATPVRAVTAGQARRPVQAGSCPA